MFSIWFAGWVLIFGFYLLIERGQNNRLLKKFFISILIFFWPVVIVLGSVLMVIMFFVYGFIGLMDGVFDESMEEYKQDFLSCEFFENINWKKLKRKTNINDSRKG